MTISEALEAIALNQAGTEMRRDWPHVILPRAMDNRYELVAWMSQHVRHGYTIEWPVGTPIVGLRDADDAFAARMRWC